MRVKVSYADSLSASLVGYCSRQHAEPVDFIAQICTGLHALELESLHFLLHISLHKVR